MISRADLLRCLMAGNDQELDGLAAALGFKREAPPEPCPLPRRTLPPAPDIDNFPVTMPPAKELPPPEQARPHFYRVTKREALNNRHESPADYPDWYTESTETLLDKGRDSWVPEHQTLRFQPLVPWARLWPFLHKALSHVSSGWQPDMEQVVRRVAQGECLRRIPLRSRKTWASTAQVLIDINVGTFGLRYDLMHLRDKLLQLRGEYGLQLRYLEDEPGGSVYYQEHEREVVEPWVTPPPDVPLLIVSDLGALTQSRRTLYAWLVFGRELAAQACRPLVLMPVPVRMMDARLLQYFDCVSWDRGGRLQPLLHARPDKAEPEKHQARVRQLLNRLAPALRVNSTLLRATRYLLAAEQFDVGHEAAVWQHPAIQSHGDEFVWQVSDHAPFLQAFRKLPAQQQQAMIDFIARYHASLPEVVYFEALQNCIQLNPEQVDVGVQAATRRYRVALVRTFNEHPDYQGLGQWTGRFEERQQASALRQCNVWLAAIKGIRLRRSLAAGEEVLYPAGIDKALLQPFLSDRKEPRRYELRQQGQQLVFSPEGYADRGDGFGVQGSWLATVNSSVDFIIRRTGTAQDQPVAHILRLGQDNTATVALDEARSYELETDQERVRVEPLTQPEWAAAIGNNVQGLWAESRGQEGDVYRWYWHPPVVLKEKLKVSVSYGRTPEAKQFLRPLIEKLTSIGVEVMRDEQIDLGDSIQDWITNVLDSSDLVISLINKKYIQSKYCMAEMRAFIDQRNPRFIPVLLEPLTLDVLPAELQDKKLPLFDSKEFSVFLDKLEGEVIAASVSPGFWYYLPSGAASLKPDWASVAGRDRYGLYADTEVAGVTQRFRWIEPTTFLMGSPENEEGRYNNEIQHEVTLTQGYWLADTACTQALWQAIMGENPSQFKDENNPVENVSWKDIVEDFLPRFNRQYPELKLRLPTEAEWENACRADTTIAFHFGEKNDLSLEKVNYSGQWDNYNSDGKIQTVKSYPPNPWGLYEMHGNVWEWCQDGFDSYPAESIVDPQGAGSGVDRVLRGSSWISFGRLCRSAYRGHGDPAARFDYGFRLARSLELPPVRSVRAGQKRVIA